MFKYIFNNLDTYPKQGRIFYLLNKSTVIDKKIADISYHNDEHWLKIWFDEELTPEEETELNEIVFNNYPETRKFELATGVEYKEFAVIGKWKKHQLNVVFTKPFTNIPNITVSNALFVNVSDMTITNIDVNGFNYMVKSTVNKNQTDIASVQFDWEGVVL